ncbi:hypothetical protein AAY23_10501, partial [Frankia casuarinae]
EGELTEAPYGALGQGSPHCGEAAVRGKALGGGEPDGPERRQRQGC